MNLTAVQSWWSQAVNHALAWVNPARPANRHLHTRVQTVMSGLRSAPVEAQFWTDFARQPGESPAGQEPNRAPAVKPLGILVPTDFSPSSFPAVDCALAIARQHTAHVILLHAVHLNVTPFGPVHAAKLKTSLCHEALAKADPILVAARKMGITAVCMVPEGPPAKMIAQIAGQCEPDLVILTNSQHGMLARLFGGRTVEKVVRTVPCPVLVLPAAGPF